MNHKLILHLGTPKTGTTALQEFLHDNTNILDELGYVFPILDDLTDDYFAAGVVNALPLMHAFDDRRLDESKKSIYERLVKRIEDELKNKSVILSSEILWMWPRLDSFITALSERIANIQVIVYLRRQDEYIESLWNHYIRTAAEHRGLFDFYKSVETETCSYLEKLRMLESKIGADNIIARIYERGIFFGDRNDIVSDFFHAIGEDIELQSSEYSDINTSLRGYSLELNRLYNEVLFGEFGQERKETLFDISYQGAFVRDDMGTFFRKLGFAEEVNKSRNYFTEEQREEIKKRYEGENEIIVREYIDKQKNGELNKYNHYLWKESGVRAAAIADFSKTECLSLKMLFLLHLRESRKNKVILRAATIGREIALYGANAAAKRLIQEGYVKNCSVIIDTFSTKKNLEGIKICSPSDYVDWKKHYIVVTTGHYDEVSETLKEKGLKEYEDFIYWSEYF